MKAQLTILIFIFLFMFGFINAREPVYYYGVNGKLVNEPDRALHRKTVKKISDTRYRIKVSAMSDEGFRLTRTERIRIQEEGLQKIRYREGTLFPRRYERFTEKADTGIYRFEEKRSGNIMRTGYTSSLVPVHLEGEVIEYYPGGKIKSVSVYNDNMLVSNKNYNEDGTEYIHDIFYSTDQPPAYTYGNEFFRKFVMSRLEKIELPEMQDVIIIGAVVMETGELTGVKVLEGNVPSVNAFFRQTVEMLPGKWEPAQLNGETVRSFIQIPFNLNKNLSEIRYLHLSKDGQLFWHD